MLIKHKQMVARYLLGVGLLSTGIILPLMAAESTVSSSNPVDSIDYDPAKAAPKKKVPPKISAHKKTKKAALSAKHNKEATNLHVHKVNMVVSLEEALAAAYNFNTEIKSQRYLLKEADEKIVQAKSDYRPNINLSANSSGSTTISGGTTVTLGQAANRANQQAASGTLSISQNLYQGGATMAAVAEAENNRSAALLQLASVEQNIFEQVVTTYLDLLSQKAQLHLLQANVDATRATLTASQEKFKVGEETRTSVAQAEAQLADFEGQLESKKAQIDSTKATFTRLTGLSNVEVKNPELAKQLPTTLAAAHTMALKNNPDIIAAQYAAEAAKQAKKRIAAGLLPKVDLQGSSAVGRTENTSRLSSTDADNPNLLPKTIGNNVTHTLTLTASMLVYDGGALRAKIREAYEDSMKARVDLEGTRRKIIESLVQLWANYKSAEANVKYSKQQVAAENIGLEGTREEMLVGTKILLDVLNAQLKLFQAQQNLVTAERDYHLASYQLLKMIGRLNAVDLALRVKRYDPQVHYISTKDLPY